LLTERVLSAARLRTPALVYDAAGILSAVDFTRAAIGGGKTKLLYALKACSTEFALLELGKKVDGFHASSLFEARLAREVLGSQGLVHLTSPGIRPEEFAELRGLCEYVSFNSVSQWERFKSASTTGKSGLRVNPQISFVPDARFDPSRKHSKLGAPLDQVVDIARAAMNPFDGISGLLVHHNCESGDYTQLQRVVELLDARLERLLERLEWINLGGGYVFGAGSDPTALREATDYLATRYGLEVFFEPGAALISSAGYLVASVLDIFASDGKQVAVLDTSVNHMPEVFEYQFRPTVSGERESGSRYLLVGSTCLAGDVFGEYTLAAPLSIGSRVIFENMGAYSLVKSHTFNGINLPNLYAFTPGGQLILKKSFTYDEFLTRCGRQENAHS
jgi:carboxynorspermidine decarboxylase